MILEPQTQGYTRTVKGERQGIERALEEHRPDGMIPRDEAVFMADDPEMIPTLGGDINYVYIVEPIGPVEKSEAHWISNMYFRMFDMSDEQAAEWSENYWEGVPGYGEPTWEYRARQAKVVREVPRTKYGGFKLTEARAPKPLTLWHISNARFRKFKSKMGAQ